MDKGLNRRYTVNGTTTEPRERSELGASLIEYALGLSLITIIVITCGTVLGNKTNQKFQEMNCKIDDAASTRGTDETGGCVPAGGPSTTSDGD